MHRRPARRSSPRKRRPYSGGGRVGWLRSASRTYCAEPLPASAAGFAGSAAAGFAADPEPAAGFAADPALPDPAADPALPEPAFALPDPASEPIASASPEPLPALPLPALPLPGVTTGSGATGGSLPSCFFLLPHAATNAIRATRRMRFIAGAIALSAANCVARLTKSISQRMIGDARKLVGWPRRPSARQRARRIHTLTEMELAHRQRPRAIRLPLRRCLRCLPRSVPPSRSAHSATTPKVFIRTRPERLSPKRDARRTVDICPRRAR